MRIVLACSAFIPHVCTKHCEHTRLPAHTIALLSGEFLEIVLARGLAFGRISCLVWLRFRPFFRPKRSPEATEGVEQKHKEDRIKKETLKAAACAQVPRRPMNRAALPPPHRPLQLPPARFPRPLGAPPRPPAAQPENFEAEIDAGQPFLPFLLQDTEPTQPVLHDFENGKQSTVMMVRRIIERQMKEEPTRADSKDYSSFIPPGLSPKICEFGSQSASVVSSGSLDGGMEPFSPTDQSSSSSPPSVSIYPSSHQSHQNSFSSCMTDYQNSFDDPSS